MFQPSEIIRNKRNGNRLSSEEIQFFIEGITSGEIADYQATAMTMAIYFQGMVPDELMSWTQAMLNSGTVFDFPSLPGKKVDKHSTGGVGDKTSLILAPIVAAAGIYVPMISGRGLGHTGGTLDKLESIPGFRTDVQPDVFEKLLKETHLVLAGQTETLVPADRKLYALRDVTATVESIPLIASSIMSKKLAEGIDALVLDVKYGDGAFMQTFESAKELALTLISIGHKMGKEVVAYLTDMNEPLGAYIGNSLEVIESCEILKGKLQNDCSELSFLLAAEMLVLGRKAQSIEEAQQKVQELIQSGKAFAKWQEIVSKQGGNPASLEDYTLLPCASHTLQCTSPQQGYVQQIHCRQIALLALELGAGRKQASDSIVPSVGVVLNKKVGDWVEAGEELCSIHAENKEPAEKLLASFVSCFVLSNTQPAKKNLVKERLSSKDLASFE